MLIQLATGLLAKIVSDGDFPEEATGRLFHSFPISAFRFKFPGGIRPDFSVEKKAGLTIGQVFGDFTLENILDKSAEKILAGQYRLKIEFSKDTGITATGTPELGGHALTAFMLACKESKDQRIRDWVAAVIANSIAEDEVTE